MKSPIRASLTGYGFILPWLIALAVFIAYPFLAGFYFSFCEFPPLQGPLFVGTENYAELAGDAVFHRSLATTLIYAAVAIPLGVFFAFTLAMLLNTRIRGQSVYRVVFYLPHLVPTVVVALLWMWMFNPEFGLLNWALGAVLSVIDAWTNLFFDLSAAPAGAGFLRPWAAALACLAAFGLLAPIALRSRPKLHAVVKNIAVVVMALAGIAVVNVALCYLLPVDMKKLHSPGWLSDGSPLPSGVPFAPPWALWALIMMSLWGVGQMAVIYLAKLQDVPAELYEAADIDGATWPQKTRHITIPMMSPVILFNVVMAIIGTFQVFTEPYIMTRGGPEDKTRFVAMFVYDQAFQYQRIGYASAVAWALFLLIVGLTLLAFYVSRKHVYYAGR
jgi:ABC-type sugar transport system permease subunit